MRTYNENYAFQSGKINLPLLSLFCQTIAAGLGFEIDFFEIGYQLKWTFQKIKFFSVLFLPIYKTYTAVLFLPIYKTHTAVFYWCLGTYTSFRYKPKQIMQYLPNQLLIKFTHKTMYLYTPTLPIIFSTLLFKWVSLERYLGNLLDIKFQFHTCYLNRNIPFVDWILSSFEF